jgi:hypothetical protein
MYDVERNSVQPMMNHGMSRYPSDSDNVEGEGCFNSSECLIAAQTAMISVVDPCRGMR